MRMIWIGLVFCLMLLGCATTRVPSYLPDTHAYQKRFYASHDEMLAAVHEALTDLGWVVERAMDPDIYEHSSRDLAEQRTLILTQVRQTPLFLGTRYARMNIFVRTTQNISEVEIRYLTITSLPLRNWASYTNDSAVERIYGRIRRALNPDRVQG